MKRTTMFLAGCLVIGVGGNVGLAQNDSAKARVGAEADNQKSSQNQRNAQDKAPQAGQLAHASRVLDMIVRNPQGKAIGAVENMIIDSQGRVAFVILSFENDFVDDDQFYAVPPQALRPGSDPEHMDLILSMSKDRFTPTSGFSEDRYPQFDERSTRETYRQFNQTPYWEGQMEDRSRDQVYQSNVSRNDLTPAQRAALDNDRDNLTATQRAARDANRETRDSRDNLQASELAAQDDNRDRHREFNQAPQFDRQYGWTSRANEIIGKEVVNSNNESLGSVKDLVIDTRQHRVVYAVLTDGGVASIGEMLTPIPYAALKARGEYEQFALDATPDSFAAISFSENAWPDLTNRQWSQRVHSQFNQQPHWVGYGNSDTYNVDKHWRHDSAYNKGYNAQRSQTIKGTVTSVNEFTPENGAAKGRQIMLRGEDGKTYTVHTGPSSFMQQQDSDYALKQGDEVTIIGSTSKFQNKDVLIASQIRTKEGKTLELRDKTGRPNWDNQNWNNDRETDRRDSDNTANNKVDRSGNTKTPMDQSEASENIKITAAIRRAVMDDDSMSMNAQNCKIITDDAGVVTLRGVVSSQAEKNSIEAKAQAVAGVTRVDNQLAVNTN